MNISEQLIKEIVAKVCADMGCDDVPFERNKLPSGVTSFKTSTVKCGPFPFDIGDANKGTSLLDLVTLEESPEMGAGIMELDHCEFPWTLHYAEFDYIIEGTLEIWSGDSKVVANAGDIIYIPRDSSIHFSAPEFARFFYISYPADWSNQ